MKQKNYKYLILYNKLYCQKVYYLGNSHILNEYICLYIGILEFSNLCKQYFRGIIFLSSNRSLCRLFGKAT